MEALKGYKTILFNLIMGVAALYTQMTGVDVDASGIIAHLTSLEGLVVEAWVGGNLWLRAITDTKIFEK